MSVRRLGGLAAIVISLAGWMACGQVYRPVVIPCSEGGIPGCPVESNPQPSNFHAVFAISTNAPSYPGGAMQIDVSGDSVVGETPTSDPSKPNLGANPTHAIIAPTNSRVFVASAGSIYAGGLDVISTFTPVFQSTLATGLGTVSTIALPALPGQASGISSLSEAGNVVTATLTSPLAASPSSSVTVPVGTAVAIAGESVSGYNGTFAITSINSTTITFTDTAAGLAPCPTVVNLVTVPCTAGGTASIPGQPVYLASTESTAIYAANFNSNSVAKINTTSNLVANTATVEPSSVTSTSPSANPVSMAEAGNANSLKLYVANQGNNTVSSLNTVDLSANTVTGFTGVTPVWVVARQDGQKVYVLTQGDGQLVTIDTATDMVTSSLPVGAGANFIFYDSHLNRLYVTNPVTAMVYVFSDTGTTSDTPTLLTSISMADVASSPCASGCTPVTPISVTALLDGSRFYVASYQTSTACPDTNVSGACVISGLTVFDANSLTVEYPSAPTLNLLSSSVFAANQYAAPQVATCAPAALYSPGSTRFRVFTAASVDSSRVYVSMCDAGVIAVVDTTDGNTNNSGAATPADTLVTDLLTGNSAGPVQANGQPALQNPIFMFAGQ